MPVLNDYDSVSILIEQICEINVEYEFIFILVDDGSRDEEIKNFLQKNIRFVHLIETQIRRGHQKAIVSGVKYSLEKYPENNIITMDSDGEDSAHNVRQLLDFCSREDSEVVLVERGKRENNLFFKIFYLIFKIVFSKLTGTKLQSGNFLYMNSKSAKSISEIPESKMHLSSSVLRYAKERDTITLDRSSRIFGKSRMNFNSLSLHAFGAISVWSDVIMARIFLVLMSFISTIFLIAVLLIVLTATNYLDHRVPGWTSTVLLQLFLIVVFILVQSVMSLLILLKLQQNLNPRR
jgi:glycosyltransferase involved in cell wall biosynthesis